MEFEYCDECNLECRERYVCTSPNPEHVCNYQFCYTCFYEQNKICDYCLTVQKFIKTETTYEEIEELIINATEEKKKLDEQLFLYDDLNKKRNIINNQIHEYECFYFYKKDIPKIIM